MSAELSPDLIAKSARALVAAEVAIGHVLKQLKRSPSLRYHLGAGSESYHQLTAAYAELTDGNVDEIREQTIPGSARVHHEDRP